jgi:competence protein ComEA
MTFEQGIDIAAPIDGGGSASPADRFGWLRKNPWAPVALRAAAIGAGMLALATIGLFSMAKSFEGASLPPGVLEARMGGGWLAPEKPAAADAGAADRPHCERPRTAEAPSAGVTADGKVILNAASADDLTRLPGVGKRRADEIIALRARLKRFRRLTDLLRVKGIGVRSLKRMQPHLVLDPPPVPEAGRVADGG